MSFQPHPDVFESAVGAPMLKAYETIMAKLNVILGSAEISRGWVAYADPADEGIADPDYACYEVINCDHTQSRVRFNPVELDTAIRMLQNNFSIDYSMIDENDGVKSIHQSLIAAKSIMVNETQRCGGTSFEIPVQALQPYAREFQVHLEPALDAT